MLLRKVWRIKKKILTEPKLKIASSATIFFPHIKHSGLGIFLRERENSNFKVIRCAAFGQLFNKNKNVCNCTLYQTLFSVPLRTKLICARSCEKEIWPLICHFPGGKASFLTQIQSSNAKVTFVVNLPKLQ